MGVGHVFDAVGDDLARGERVEHPVMPMAMPSSTAMVLNSAAKQPQRFDALFDMLADLVQVHVARTKLRETNWRCR